MLRAAALVPETVLLVPGAAGRADVLEAERAAALEAVGRVVAAGPSRLVVVAPGRRSAVHQGALVPTLGGAGLADDSLDWRVASDPAGPDGAVVVNEVAGAVGLLLARRAGWTSEVTVLVVPPDDAAAARSRGATLAQDDVGLVVTGSLSARHGPQAPLADDPEAPDVDAWLVEELGRGEAGLSRAADLPAERAVTLAISAWAPLQVLAGAAGEGGDHHTRPDGVLRGDVLHTSVVHGACYVSAAWVRG
ncbi:hypothetical protein GXB85_13975 [Cellulomonas sp. APG4]|uniref:hypothetical protein n=1 Tax=Cellulomonas sp. APG4 TaxID=1538656 RepID=UPI00137A7220|nr:hypothetical protein [Cellulomonas sp. APG4]NCT92051.1 hypothetical protein [Cellulomonas sp. APG4]